MLLSDYHMHTNYSIDGTASMEEMILAARAKGLREIAITDHCDYIYPDLPFDYQIDCRKYQRELQGLAEKYSGDISVKFGIELGLARQLGQTSGRLASEFDFDFIIGSIHAVGEHDLYFGSYFDGKNKTQSYGGYFDELFESVKNNPDFCVVGHMDFVSRYGKYGDNAVYYGEFRDIIDAILRFLVEDGKGLEINTSGYRYGINGVYPQLSILKRFKEMGGEIVTVGSDAHYPRDIGKNFKEAEEILKLAGFGYHTHFNKRTPQFVML